MLVAVMLTRVTKLHLVLLKIAQAQAQVYLPPTIPDYLAPKQF